MSANPLPASFPPLDAEKSALFASLTDGLDPQALAWISGYAAGMAAERLRQVPASPEAVAPPLSAVRATVLYGSQTGNGRRLAERLKQQIEASGHATRVVSAADYSPRALADERLLYLIVSTHGDGDPPDDARGLVEFIQSRRAPRLEKLSFAVFALGDSSYPQFCATGRALDERLAALGAHRLLPRVDADLDVDTVATPWLEQALASVRAEAGVARLATVTPLRPLPITEATRDHPLEVEVLAQQRITGRGALRDVRHLELAVPDGRLRYEPGDAIGIWPENPAATVDRITELLGVRGDRAVMVGDRERTLKDWLTRDREITRLTRPLIEMHAERSGDASLKAALKADGAPALRRLLRDLQLVDLLREYSAPWTPEQLIATLRPLAPRLYSVASSRRLVGSEAHLTVAIVDGHRQGESRPGAASGYVAGSGGEGARLKVFLESNPRFRLPADASRDIIMIGPGTGVAPFRGFVQERAVAGATGRQWLFFGARHLDSEFLYQTEWLDALKRGVLHRLDVAFSRDQAEKVYVQHRLLERGEELYRWLEGGASIYVCGDAERMAPDVEAALVSIVERHGATSREAAVDYLRTLAAEKRYLRDVY